MLRPVLLQIMMEEESCFLSKEDDNKIKLKKIFETVINDLNEKKVTTIVGNRIIQKLTRLYKILLEYTHLFLIFDRG